MCLAAAFREDSKTLKLKATYITGCCNAKDASGYLGRECTPSVVGCSLVVVACRSPSWICASCPVQSTVRAVVAFQECKIEEDSSADERTRQVVTIVRPSGVMGRGWVALSLSRALRSSRTPAAGG